MFVVCLDNVRGTAKESLATILDQAKFVQAIPITGMAGNILPMEASGHPALRFERIFNHSRIQEFAPINCLSYDVPEETSLSLIKEEMFWHEHAYGFVAYKAISRCPPRRQSSTKPPLSVHGGNDARSTAQRVWGSSGTTCPTDSPRSDRHQEDRTARYRGRKSALFASWIPSDREIMGCMFGVLTG
jgi:hypothetical protein